ncbi:52 kDa repressor of the inhibitor of the kinase-like, partial [Paramuricea clavata]
MAKETKERKPSLVDLYRELLQEPECFPNLSKIIKIALTLPLTSASAERSFSRLKIIKNRLRSTIRQDRLELLMLMSVESDICRGLDIEGLEAKTHRERELKKAEEDLNKIKKKAEDSSKDMKDKEQEDFFLDIGQEWPAMAINV